MSVAEQLWASRERIIRRIRSGIRATQFRVALDEARGRHTPEAVMRLAELTMPSPFDTLRTPGGTAGGSFWADEVGRGQTIAEQGWAYGSHS